MAQQDDKSKLLRLILPKEWADFINANLQVNPLPGANKFIGAYDLIIGSIMKLPLIRDLPGVEALGNTLVPTSIPEFPELLEAWIRGYMKDDKFVKWGTAKGGYNLAGLTRDMLNYTVPRDGKLDVNTGPIWYGGQKWNGIWANHTEVPGFAEILVMLNRGLITKDLAAQWMNHLKFTDPAVIRTMLDLRYEIPPNSDLIRWAVRHAFDPDIVTEFGYRDEVPTLLYKFSEANGLGGSTGVDYPAGKDNKGNAIPAGPASWFDMEWASHWIFPSVGQGYDMLHRLYPNSPYGPSPDGTKDTAFDADKLKLLLRAQDIPPYWRDRLIAISYNPYSRVDVRRMYNAGILNNSDVYHAYRSQGYDDTKAQQLLKFAQKQFSDTQRKQFGNKAIKQYCESYTIGAIDKATFTGLVQDITDDEDETTQIVNECDFERNIKHLKAEITAVKHQFVKGILDTDDVRQYLTNLGVTQDAVSNYLSEWHFLIQSPRKEAHAGELISWFEQGILAGQTVYDRLITLGYDAGDASAMLRVASAKISARNAKQASATAKQAMADSAKQQKAQQAAQKQAAQQAKQAVTTAKQALKQSLTGITERKLRSWYVAKEIDYNTFAAYLGLMGWTANTITQYLTELDREIATKTVIAGPGSSPSVATE